MVSGFGSVVLKNDIQVSLIKPLANELHSWIVFQIKQQKMPSEIMSRNSLG